METAAFSRTKGEGAQGEVFRRVRIKGEEGGGDGPESSHGAALSVNERKSLNRDPGTLLKATFKGGGLLEFKYTKGFT